MFTHHIVTVALLTLSYTVNFLRIGSLIMCLHDSVDIVLEVSRLSDHFHDSAFNTIVICSTFFPVWSEI